VSLPIHGIPTFQVTFIDSNMLMGASDDASNESEINTPSLAEHMSCPWNPPADPRRISECGASDNGVPVRTIAARSAAVAGL
jgi:hypothetical protein